VRARNLSNGWSHRQPDSRRVVVKSRSVRLAGRSGKAAAHLRYIQRDGRA
jgi:type IV secretory pathway VirD2 relaxase